MLKPLLRVNPSLSGNVKIQCNLSDYINSGVNTYTCNIRGAYLNPIASILMNKNIYVNMLGSSYEFDLKKYYNSYRDVFYDNCNNINFDIIQQIDKTRECKTRNTDFEMGAQRISFLQTGNKFQFLAPIYIDDINDIPQYFKITVTFYKYQFALKKDIIIPIGQYNELNHFYRYLMHYLQNIDNKVFTSDINQKCGFYYGIDLVNGGFVKAKDTVIRNVFQEHNTINNFDAILTYGFKRNKLVMRQILPLCFEFDTNNILTASEAKYYKNCEIEISGNYYDKNDNQVDWYDFDMNYDNKTFNILRYNEDAAKLQYVISNNVMNQSYPALLEKTYFKYKYANKIGPTFNRWKLLESTDENPYIANNSYAFTRLQGTTATYGEFPSSYEMCNALIVFDKLYDDNLFNSLGGDSSSEKTHQYILKKIYDGDLVLPSTYTYNNSKLFGKWKTNYINALNRYSFNWYQYYYDDENDIFNKVNWTDVLDNFSYSSNILYNFNNITDESGKAIKIDKFANVLKINFSNNQSALSTKYVVSSNDVASDFFITQKYAGTSNYLFMPHIKNALMYNKYDVDDLDDQHDDWMFANIQYNKRCIKYDKYSKVKGKYINIDDLKSNNFKNETYFNIYDIIRIYKNVISNRFFNTAVFNPSNIINAFNKIQLTNNEVNGQQYFLNIQNDVWYFSDVKNANDTHSIIDIDSKSFINAQQITHNGNINIENLVTTKQNKILSGVPGTFVLCSDGLDILIDEKYSMVVKAPEEVESTKKYYTIRLYYITEESKIQLVDACKIYCVKNRQQLDRSIESGGYIYVKALQILYNELTQLILDLENAAFEGYQFLNISALKQIITDENITLFDNIHYKVNEISSTYNDAVDYELTYEFLKNSLYIDNVLNVNNVNVSNSCLLFNGNTFLNKKLLNINQISDYYVSGNNILLKLNLINHSEYQKLYNGFINKVNSIFENDRTFSDYDMSFNQLINNMLDILKEPEFYSGFDISTVDGVYNVLNNIFNLSSLTTDYEFIKNNINVTYQYYPMFIYNENDVLHNIFMQKKSYQTDDIIYVDRYNLSLMYNIFHHIGQRANKDNYKTYLNTLIDVNEDGEKKTLGELFDIYGLLDEIFVNYIDNIKGQIKEEEKDDIFSLSYANNFIIDDEINKQMTKYCKIINVNHLITLIGLMTSGKQSYDYNTKYYNALSENIFIREKVFNTKVRNDNELELNLKKRISIRTNSKLINIFDKVTNLGKALLSIKDENEQELKAQQFLYTFISKIYYKDNAFYLPVIDDNFNYTGQYIMGELYYKCKVMPLNRYMLDAFLKETQKMLNDKDFPVFNSDLYVMMQESDTDFYGGYDILTEDPVQSNNFSNVGFYVNDELFYKPLYTSANYQKHETTLLYDYILSKYINYEQLYNYEEDTKIDKNSGEYIDDTTYVRYNRFNIDYLYEYNENDLDYIKDLPTYDIINTPKAYNKIIPNSYLKYIYIKNQLYNVNLIDDVLKYNNNQFSENNIQMNIYVRDGLTYLLRYIDVYIDNTSASLKMLTQHYITPNSFNTINSHYIDNYLIQYLLPYVKLDFYKIFMQNKFIVLPEKYVMPIRYNPYKIQGEQYSYIEAKKKNAGHMISYRWLNRLTPLIYKAKMIKDCYNIKYKNTNNKIFSNNNSLYKETVHIDIYNKIRIYNKEDNGNAYEEYVPIEYKHFNVSKFINLDEVIEYTIHKSLTYEELIKYENDELVFSIFKQIIGNTLNNKYTDDEIRFLFLKYNVEYVTNTLSTTSDTNMLYTLKYKFILK